MSYLYHVDHDGVPSQGWEIPAEPFIVGRGETADAMISDHALSRSHFMILRENGQEFVVDLDSQNGTSLNGHRITGTRVQSGAIIHAGNSIFYYSAQRLPTHARPLPLSHVPAPPPAPALQPRV